jgi:hypothetical protein
MRKRRHDTKFNDTLPNIFFVFMLCRNAACRCGEFRYANCHHAMCDYADCHSAECHYADSHAPLFTKLLMFMIKARAYPSEALSGVPLYTRLLALPINIRLSWKGLPGTNTPAYYEYS